MQNVGAVILAAGGSSRFGSAKQLAQFGEKSFVRRIADAAQEAGCSPIAIVVGNDSEKIRAESTASVVENENWREGIGASIRTGIKRLLEIAPESRAVVLLVCDQPFVGADVIRHLVALWKKTGKAIVASSYSDTLGVPALFTREVFPQLMALSGDSGAKKIILGNRDRVAELPFPEGNIDIDTPADYENLGTKSSVPSVKGFGDRLNRDGE